MSFSGLSLTSKITIASLFIVMVAVAGNEAFSYYSLVKSGMSEELAWEMLSQGLVISGIVSIVLAIILSYTFARYLVSPLEKMVDAMNQLASGDYDIKVEFNRGREAESISEAFNSMVNILKQQRGVVDSYSKNLELKVEQRTAELREKDKAVFHSSKLASIGQLASGVAHEINNPLQIIIGNTELIETVLDDAEPDIEFMKGRIGSIQDSVTRVGRIVNGLRVYARTDDEDDATIFAADDLVENCIKLVTNIYKSDGVDITYDFQAKQHKLEGSEGKFQQVIMNLLSNAKDAMESKGGGKIHVQTINEMDRFVVKVIDSGEGISDENKDKIFDQFFTTKAVGKGTGLGMGIIHGIVTSMEGTVNLESTLGEGTTFTLNFPVAEGEEQIVEEEEIEFTPLQGRVLVVDDEEAIRNVLSYQLKGFGLDVDTAANGIEALMLIRTAQYDVLVTDMSMPIMNGESLIESVKEIEYQMKIFLITGEVGFEGKSQEEWEKQVDGFLSKPFRKQYVHALLKMHLEDFESSKAA